jgi:hypothetical protein
MAFREFTALICCLFFALASSQMEAHAHRLRLRHHHHYHYRHVVAQGPSPRQTPLYIYHTPLPCYSRDDCDRKDYDESGSRGRTGLGASPFHPEGPGNPSY